MTKQEYDKLKALDESLLTDEARKAILEYERKEAGAPSEDDFNTALKIMNEKDSIKQKMYRESGAWDWASSIKDQNQRTREVMQQKGQKPWVVPVKTKPEDIQSNYDFNWISAYENATGEPLEATEADADKLQKFIDANMFEVGDPSTDKWGNSLLKKRAYEMHMYNPNSMKWEDFINSDQWPEFQKYLNDVRKYQEGKEINKIWNEGVDPARGLTSFMLPASYEYAKKNYKNIDGLGDIAVPLAADVAANVAMTGTGINAIKNPWTRFVLENAAAPAITEATNYGLGNKSAAKAATDFITGAATNVGTPVMLEGFGNRFTRFTPKTSKKRAEWQKKLDDAATKARQDKKMLDEGQAVLVNKDVGGVPMSEYKGQQYLQGYTPAETYTLPRIDDKELQLGLSIADKNDTFLQNMADKGANLLNEIEINKKLDRGENLTLPEIHTLMRLAKESKLNRIKNSKFVQSAAPLIKNYLTNVAGREQAGQRVIGGPLHYLFDTNLFEKDGKETTDQKIERLFGVKKKKENDK